VIPLKTSSFGIEHQHATFLDSQATYPSHIADEIDESGASISSISPVFR
jgi:hypothetical protein